MGSLLDDNIQITTIQQPQQSIIADDNIPTELTVTECNELGSPPASSPDTVTSIEIAGEGVNAHRAIFRFNQRAFTANNSVNFFIVGVSVNSALMNAELTIRNFGVLVFNGWSFMPDKPIFFDQLGMLTQTPPTTGVLTIIAHAMSATDIFINIQEPIIRS